MASVLFSLFRGSLLVTEADARETEWRGRSLFMSWGSRLLRALGVFGFRLAFPTWHRQRPCLALLLRRFEAEAR